MRIWPFDWMTIDIFDPQPSLFHQLNWMVAARSLNGGTVLHPVSVGHMTLAIVRSFPYSSTLQRNPAKLSARIFCLGFQGGKMDQINSIQAICRQCGPILEIRLT